MRQRPTVLTGNCQKGPTVCRGSIQDSDLVNSRRTIADESLLFVALDDGATITKEVKEFVTCFGTDADEDVFVQ